MKRYVIVAAVVLAVAATAAGVLRATTRRAGGPPSVQARWRTVQCSGFWSDRENGVTAQRSSSGNVVVASIWERDATLIRQ